MLGSRVTRYGKFGAMVDGFGCVSEFLAREFGAMVLGAMALGAMVFSAPVRLFEEVSCDGALCVDMMV